MLETPKLATTAIPLPAPAPRPAHAAGTRKPVRLVHMGAVSMLLAERLPLSEADVAALLVSEGLVPAPLDLAALARLYRAAGDELPFQIARCGGMALAVGGGAGAVASQIGAVAIRMALYWGLTSVGAVAQRASALTSSVIAETIAARLLSAMPRVHWLDDERRQWFSVTGEAGRLEVAIRKIFAVSPAVPIDELRAALARALPGAYEAPRRIFTRCLVELGHCAVDREVARATKTVPADALTPQEALLVQLLDDAGGGMSAPVLRRLGQTAGIPKTTINQMLRSSPLFVPVTPSEVRLVGRDRGA